MRVSRCPHPLRAGTPIHSTLHSAHPIDRRDPMPGGPESCQPCPSVALASVLSRWQFSLGTAFLQADSASNLSELLLDGLRLFLAYIGLECLWNGFDQSRASLRLRPVTFLTNRIAAIGLAPS